MAAGTPHSRVLVIDDHPVFRAGLLATLAGSGCAVQAHEAGSVGQALQALAQGRRFDLIVYDWTLGSGGGMKGFVALAQMAPRTPMLVVSARDDDELLTLARSAGAVGCLCKTAPPAQLAAVLRRWLNERPAGDPPVPAHGSSPALPAPSLTPRQHDVLTLMALGDANKIIATKLRIALTTVRDHVSDILRLLKARNRTEAVVRAAQLGLI